MEGLLKKGTELVSESGTGYIIEELLGTGGQGEVYKVSKASPAVSKKEMRALKWYFKHTALPEQQSILERAIRIGSPDKTFLWPEEMMYDTERGTYGYIMPLRPKNYKGIVDLMKRRVRPSFETLCRAGFNLAKGYNNLHAKGYAYSDINYGNVFFEPDKGDVLICDNDNIVTKDDKPKIAGTLGFMAPEIVRTEARPSLQTDRFSLAVLLFLMFMIHHPLEGALEAKIKALDYYAKELLYGKNPVFIFDPDNDSNRPVPEYHGNAIIFWDIYPKQIKDLFTQSFTIGLNEPNSRVTEKQWMDAFMSLLYSIILCKCGAEVFCVTDSGTGKTSAVCWNEKCKKILQPPISFVIGNKQRVYLTPDTVLYSHLINGDYDINTVIGSVVQNPTNPNIYGIRNDSNDNWTYIKTDGTHIPVAQGKTAGITIGAKINFGKLVSEFI